MFGLIPLIPIGLVILAIIWFIYEEYCYIQGQYKPEIHDILLNTMSNGFFIAIIWVVCVGAIGLVNYIYNTSHTSFIITTKYEVESYFDLTDSNIAPGKYVIYDSDSNKYCYYTISFNEVTKNVKSGDKLVVLPVLDDGSSYTPQFICQMNEQRGYYPDTSPITMNDCIKDNYDNISVNMLIIPIDGILYGPVPNS